MLPAVPNTIGKIDQLGFVVTDLYAAIDHWTKRCGVGPFFVHEHVAYETFTYRGEETPIDLSLAFSFIGDLQIELIYQHNDVPSMYTTLKQSAPNGLVHMARYDDDLEAASAGLIANGAKLIQYSRDIAGVETIYLDTDFHNGGLIEFIKVKDIHKQRGAIIKSQANSWDGQHPIRSFDHDDPLKVVW